MRSYIFHEYYTFLFRMKNKKEKDFILLMCGLRICIEQFIILILGCRIFHLKIFFGLKIVKKSNQKLCSEKLVKWPN